MSSYQPFSATHGPGGGFDTGGEDFEPGTMRIKVKRFWRLAGSKPELENIVYSDSRLKKRFFGFLEQFCAC